MKRYEAFKKGFLNDIIERKNANRFTDLYCRDVWKFDAAQLLRKKSSPHIITFFRYCKATAQCPVKFMITQLKDFINPHELIAFIQTLYNLQTNAPPNKTLG